MVPYTWAGSKVLGEWQVQLSTEGIIEAMATCDDESRYWMLLGLESLSEVDPIAMGAIQSLTYDTDIFYSYRSGTLVGDTMITWLFAGCMSVHKVGTLVRSMKARLI